MSGAGRPRPRGGLSFGPDRPMESRGGAVAQLGERVNGIHEVRGSIPLGSTNEINGLVGSMGATAGISRAPNSLPG